MNKRINYNKKKYPLVSVIIPTYNSENYIVETITSVINQSYPNLEIIVIDDGSTDNTKNILLAYVDKIKYFKIPHSGLPAVARNAGIELAKGNYLAFLDSDDIWLSEKISKQMKILLGNNDIGLISTNAVRFIEKIERKNIESSKNLYFHLNSYNSGKYQFKELLCDNFIITSSVIIRRYLLKEIGIFSEDKKMRAIEDYHLWLRIALIADIYYIKETLVKYRDRNNSIRSHDTQFLHYRKMLWLLSDILRIIRENNYDKLGNKKNTIMKIMCQKMFILNEIFKLCFKMGFSKVFPSNRE
jgi:glycosyltransferase involved in cell wall biosynthesis